MVLNDTGVDEYIDLDMTEVDIAAASNDINLSEDIKFACLEKLKFRN